MRSGIRRFSTTTWAFPSLHLYNQREYRHSYMCCLLTEGIEVYPGIANGYSAKPLAQCPISCLDWKLQYSSCTLKDIGKCLITSQSIFHQHVSYYVKMNRWLENAAGLFPPGDGFTVEWFGDYRSTKNELLDWLLLEYMGPPYWSCRITITTTCEFPVAT